MEEVTILFIRTRWKAESHQFVMINNLSEYKGVLMDPIDIVNHFIIDYPMFDVVCADVCKRVINTNPTGKDFMWITLNKIK